MSEEQYLAMNDGGSLIGMSTIYLSSHFTRYRDLKEIERFNRQWVTWWRRIGDSGLSLGRKLKIGEIVTLPDGRKAEVKEAYYGCRDCAFYPSCDCYDFKTKENTYCSCVVREDKKNIIYKEIKEN